MPIAPCLDIHDARRFSLLHPGFKVGQMLGFRLPGEVRLDLRDPVLPGDTQRRATIDVGISPGKIFPKCHLIRSRRSLQHRISQAAGHDPLAFGAQLHQPDFLLLANTTRDRSLFGFPDGIFIDGQECDPTDRTGLQFNLATIKV